MGTPVESALRSVGIAPGADFRDELRLLIRPLERPAGNDDGVAGDADEKHMASFSEMIERIRSRYMLAYHEPRSTPGAFRHITVKLADAARRRYPAAELHCRNGYYAE